MLVRRRRDSEGAPTAPHVPNGRYPEEEANNGPPSVADRIPDRAAAVPPAPQGPPPVATEGGPPPTTLKRGQMRRRLRYLRRLRELALRDIGGFLVECRRFGRDRADLVEAKVAEAAEVDREVRTLERALETGPAFEELRQPGIGGACSECGTVFGSGDRFCAWCGHQL